MAEEVIVTRFLADVSDLDAKVKEAAGGIDALDSSAKKTEGATDRLGGSVGDLSAKTRVLDKASREAAKGLDAEAASARKAATETAKVGNAASRSGGLLNRLGNGIKGAFNGVKGAVSQAGQALQRGFGNVGSMLGNVAGSVGGVASQFAAMGGPIGLAAVAVGGFIANFSRLDDVATRLDGVKRGFQSFLDLAAGSPKTILQLVNPFLAASDPKGFVSGLKEIAQGFKDGQDEAQRFDEIADKALGASVTRAGARVEVAKLEQQLQDLSKTEEERIAIADQIIQKERAALLEEQAIIRERIALQEDINSRQARQGRLGEVSDENKAALAELLIEQERINERSVRITERAERYRNQIVERATAEREALAAREAAEAERRHQEELRRIAQREAAEKGLANLLKGIQDEQLRAGLSSELAQQEFDIDQRFQVATEQAVGYFKTQEELAQGDAEALARIEQEKGQALAIIQAAWQATLARNREAYFQKEQEDAQRADEQARKNAQGVADFYNAQYEQQLQAQQQLMEQRVGIISDSAAAATSVLAQAAAEGESLTAETQKALLLILLDALEKQITLQGVGIVSGTTAGGATTGGPAGAAAGLAQGLALSALIKALFAGAKAAISAAYTGEEYVGGKPMWSGRDGHLRRVHTGERIVTAKDNAENYDLLHAMHVGRLDDFIDRNYVFPAINAYLKSDEGQRASHSVTFPHSFDKNIVQSLALNATESRKQTRLLQALVTKEAPRRHNRYW